MVSPDDRHIVGVHHAMNETDEHPLGDEVRLPRNHKVQERERRGSPRERLQGNDGL